MRPIKAGLDYFPHDTDAVNDSKIQSLMALYGTDGYAFYFIMLEKSFRSSSGCLSLKNDAEKAGYAKLVGIPLKRFNLILSTSLEVGCFSLENDCLTSPGIQKRILTVNEIREKERKRKEEYKDKYKDKKEIENLRRKTRGKLAENYFELFEIFWQLYPRKESKKKALEIFLKISPQSGLFEQITEALKKVMKSEQWTKDGGKFIPLPTTWLNGKRWEDEGITASIVPLPEEKSFFDIEHERTQEYLKSLRQFKEA